MGIKFQCVTKENVEQVRLWRNEVIESLRTPFLLTKEMQEGFYDNVICNRSADSRWWAVHDSYDCFVGLTGLTSIAWENGTAEISLIINPNTRGKGYGMKAVSLLLQQGFDNLGLQTIYGECYECNPALSFWHKVINWHEGYITKLPKRKRWNGKLYDSIYFSISRE